MQKTAVLLRFSSPLWGFTDNVRCVLLIGKFLVDLIIELFSLAELRLRYFFRKFLSFCHNPCIWQTDRKALAILCVALHAVAR